MLKIFLLDQQQDKEDYYNTFYIEVLKAIDGARKKNFERKKKLLLSMNFMDISIKSSQIYL